MSEIPALERQGHGNPWVLLLHITKSGSVRDASSKNKVKGDRGKKTSMSLLACTGGGVRERQRGWERERGETFDSVSEITVQDQAVGLL